MLESAHEKGGSADAGRKILFVGLVVLVIMGVVWGVLYCLLALPPFIFGLTPQGPIGFH